MAEPDAVPEEPWAGRIAGPKKRPHPPIVGPIRFSYLSVSSYRTILHA